MPNVNNYTIFNNQGEFAILTISFCVLWYNYKRNDSKK
jgi:hypothetical protein